MTVPSSPSCVLMGLPGAFFASALGVGLRARSLEVQSRWTSTASTGEAAGEDTGVTVSWPARLGRPRAAAGALRRDQDVYMEPGDGRR